MSQLTITSHYVRRGIKIGVITLLSFFILKTSFTIARAYWRKLNPPPEPPPDTAYGKLPNVSFPDQKKRLPVNFNLQTIDNQLPTDLKDRAKVIYLPKIGGKFSKLDDAQITAEQLDLNPNGQELSSNVYLFKNSANRTQMKINVLTQNFTYAYDYVHDQTLINPPVLPTKEKAVSIGEQFLKSIDRLTEEITAGNKEISYWKVKGENLVSAISASEADFIRVNFFRQKVEEEYPIMPPTYPQAQVSLLITSQSIQGKQVVEAKYTYFESDPEEFAVYPLLPIETAWERVKDGEYYLASFEGQPENGVTIRRIYLAYYDPPQPTHFLQPIYVFQGDNEFVGYYPAIPPEWRE
jgi:hypothetical protein